MHALTVGEAFLDKLEEQKHGSHAECVLTYIVAGEMTVAHRAPFQVLPGMFNIVPPGVPHSLLEGSGLQVLWLSFCPDCLSLTSSDLMMPFECVKRGELPARKTQQNRREFIVTLFHELMVAQQRKLALEVQRSFVILLLNELNQASALASNQTQYNAKVESALAYIQANFLQPIGLNEVSTAVHVSPPYLATLFKRETGYTVGQWITEKRLAQACTQLLHTALPVSQLAETLGWSDTTHFIRQFKKHLGQTPAAWRKENKK
ncbi:helix-turn-helix domain-containing protein [Pseudoalteromonas obscura]|uniref:AraC family transcriptional regulator n=1 Tax=Pseudoalteromonas obscura TaxID=3048491 RepID=A0ABT7EGY1_9GAMM|nr:AraC family transcriptional regulator [Pseudoalteromonas sp. P94(2023)]MDK2594300.1 AraC family transcriptional regulator [Pseudoalteromonas sp. P94(2023)]